MTPQKNTAAASLEGMDLSNGWQVVGRIERPPGATGGHFSESYVVEQHDGTKGFLKAFDYSAALEQPNTAETLQAMTTAYLFERDLLRECAEARMSRVVLALRAGEVDVAGHGLLSRVSYLIFERAERDIRRHRDLLPQLDVAWALRSLHHVATGLLQLHGKGITHQDVKPSNVLVFADSSSKIGDLGRASKYGSESPSDEVSIPGDRNYAPPELLYEELATDPTIRRRACDMYHLGSMIMFFFAGIGTTGAIAADLNPAHMWGNWTQEYVGVLPYLIDSFDRVAARLESHLPDGFQEQLGVMFRELCHPELALRGDPKAPRQTRQRYSLQRYVSRLDLLAREAEIVLRKVTRS